MGWLFPLYALGLLAIGLPVVFHLIQRRPQGQVQFSSLMFLSPSPPRLTRRSRLEHLWLLLLRALVLILLALAFTRPFLRSAAQLSLDTPARRTVLAVDTSASMQREGLWQQAIDEVNNVLEDVQPTDQLALLTFDTGADSLIGFEDWRGMEVSGRPNLIRGALADCRPGWRSTDLGQALVAACDVLQNATEEAGSATVQTTQVILITDLQVGSRLDALEGFVWPKDVHVDVRPVAPPRPNRTNASAQVLRSDTDDDPNGPLRVRVYNATDSSRTSFRVAWSTADGKKRLAEYAAAVPPGETRVAHIERPPPGIDRLVIQGDEHDFDNTVYVATREPPKKRLLYVGQPAEGRESLFYYLQLISFDNSAQIVTVAEQQPGDSLEGLDHRTTPLVVLGAAIPPDHVAQLRSYLERGGRTLVVLHAGAVPDQAALTCWRELLALPDLTIEEAGLSDYAMLSRIAFDNPLFLPLADPRYNDFTNIRFWKHRRMLCSHEHPWTVIARFDDQLPALVEQRREAGVLWVLASGWQPSESQLALSNKFVPILARMLDPRGGRPVLEQSCTVGQSVPLPATQGLTSVTTPDGKIVTVDRDDSRFEQTDSPGIYGVIQGDTRQTFAVNLDERESHTALLDKAQLEERGVVTQAARTMDEIQAERQQMQNDQLESRQKLWRWLIAGALVVLVAETLVAGRLARKAK